MTFQMPRVSTATKVVGPPEKLGLRRPEVITKNPRISVLVRHGIQPRLRYESVAKVSYSEDRNARNRSSALLPGYKPHSRIAAATHTTLMLIARQVRADRAVCVGGLTTGT